MLFISLVSLALASVTIATSGIFVPIDQPNGFYEVHALDDGTYEHVALGSAKRNVATIPAAVRPRADVGPHCNAPPQNLDASDFATAEANFQNTVGNGYCFGGPSYYSVYNNAVAFGCNYASYSCVSGKGFSADIQSVDAYCGDTIAGYFYHGDNGDSFGRTISGLSYC